MSRSLLAPAAFVLALVLLPAVSAGQTAANPERLRTMAEAGDAAAKLALGELYQDGLQVAQDYAEAARWYEAAVGAGLPEAQNRLAVLYASGRGVERDGERARALFEAAAAAGDPKHILDLATAIEAGIGGAPDYERAAELYAEAAEKGSLESAVSLGVLYQDGRGVPQDFGKAVELWRGPAEAGNARAQNNLGLMYTRGTGVAQDYTLGAEWFARAAEQGLAEAIRNLGVMYQNGFGVQQDESHAEALYRQAAAVTEIPAVFFDPRLAPPVPERLDSYVAGAEAGDPVAQYLVGYLLAADPQDVAQTREAARWFERAAARGSAAAMANLGLMAFRGEGRLQDYVEGYVWLSLAAMAGLPEAGELRDLLAERMTGAQINAANTETVRAAGERLAVE